MIAALRPDARGHLAAWRSSATLLLVMLGGASIPAFMFPQWLQTVSLFVPTRWAIDGLDAMTWRGLPLQAAMMPVAVMMGFTALFGAVAVARFDWEE
ncbi:MAG: ABC transporter permease [Burkholderiaceae bacterium]